MLPAPLLRPLTRFDSALLAELHRPAFPEEPWDQPALAGLLAFPGCFGTLALTPDGSLPLGFALGRVAADEAEVLTLCVLPACRRSGIGQRLLERLEGDARARAAATLFLEVAVDNEAALGLYHSAGYDRIGRRRAYYRRGDAAVDALVLVKRL